jgi:hypothetical protein
MLARGISPCLTFKDTMKKDGMMRKHGLYESIFLSKCSVEGTPTWCTSGKLSWPTRSTPANTSEIGSDREDTMLCEARQGSAGTM